MKREVVQDFLNLPGIVGYALMDGRSRPYFCGVDQTLNSQQREALAQGIHQVIDTTPATFEFFEFQFNGYQVYIYKLEHGIILLVLTNGNLISSAYQETIERLKLELKTDVASAIATFRLLAGTLSLSGQSYWKRQAETVTSSHKNLSSAPTVLNDRPQDLSLNTASTLGDPPVVPSNGSLNSPSLPPEVTPPPVQAMLQSGASVNLIELLNAINHLSQFTTQYLGTTVVVNYWKTTRPDVDWLTQFEVERSAQMTFSGQFAAGNLPILTAEQHQWMQSWVAVFIERCAKVIRDYPKIVRQKALDDQQKSLLLSDNP